MSIRVQVILDEEDAARFKSQAQKESKSLSSWLRDAGRKMLEMTEERKPLSDPDSLRSFFQACDGGEEGTEPDWEEHRQLILEGFRQGTKS